MSERAKGHSLLELLLAMGLFAVLAAGLLKVLGLCLGSLERVGNALTAQRSLRRASERLVDDLLEMGFVLPCREGLPAQPLFALDPGRPVEPDLAGTSAWEPRAQGYEMTFLQDRVLAGGGSLAEAVRAEEASAAPFRMTVLPSEAGKLQAGDLVVVEDDGWEAARVAEPAALHPGRPQALVTAPPGPGADRVFRRNHEPGAEVRFLRPLVTIRYRLVRLPRTGPSGPVPALARFDEAAGAPLLFEHITAFRVTLPRGPGVPVPPLVQVTLEARCGTGPRRRTTVLCAPRNGPGRP